MGYRKLLISSNSIEYLIRALKSGPLNESSLKPYQEKVIQGKLGITRYDGKLKVWHKNLNIMQKWHDMMKDHIKNLNKKEISGVRIYSEGMTAYAPANLSILSLVIILIARLFN